METTRFLRRALSDTGPYCALAIQKGNIEQRFFNTIEELANYSNEADESGKDAYFALGTFKSKASRNAVNVRDMRSFFIDIDCRPEKDQTKNYANKKDGLAALRKFCVDTGLPRPFLVDSGGGIHAYWFLDEPAPVSDWLPIAKKLKSLCAKHGFRIDKAVPADAARVLRVPNTKNYKDEPPTTVSFLGLELTPAISLSKFSSILGNVADTGSGGIFKGVIQGSDALVDSHVNNIEAYFKVILQKSISGRGCAQIRYIVGEQEAIEEPLWRAGLSIAKFCEDGRKAAHIISNKHSDYDPEETEKKLEKIAGPYTCDTFRDLNPEFCEKCKHKITSPIVLGQKIKEATDEDNTVTAKSDSASQDSVQEYKIPQYPKPYFRGANGGVYVRTVNKDGDDEERVIYHNDLYVVKRVKDAEEGECIVMRLHLPRDGVREFTVPLTAATSKDEFRKVLAAQGVAVTRMDDIMYYAMSWVNKLQISQTADIAHTQFGWTDEKGTSFVIGDSEIFADRVEFNPPSSKTSSMMDAFKPQGSLEEWKKAMDFYNRPGFEVHQFVVGLGFGSVLMQFTPLMSAGFHMFSKDSGVGKTTALRAALSIWGNPDELMLTDQDTMNTKMHRGEVYHNLPLCVDEMTNTTGSELSNFAYQITGGRQRGRMRSSSNSERHRGKPWRLLAITTGNASIVERIASFKTMPKAEAMRILEYNMPTIEFDTKNETDVFSAQLLRNYGWAGRIFVTYCINNIEQVKHIYKEVQRRVDTQARLTAQNRFWSEATTCGIAGNLIASKLGLVNYSSRNLFHWAVNDMLSNNGENYEELGSPIEEMLNDYVYEYWANFIWIKSTEVSTGKNNNGLDTLTVPDQMPRASIRGRYEPDTKTLYLLPKPFRTWCTDQQLNYAQVRDTLKRKMGAYSSKVRIDKGTKMSLPPVNVLVVRMNISEKHDEGNVKKES